MARRRGVLGAATAALAALIGFSGVAMAAYYPNTGALGAYQGASGATWDGLAGFQMLTPLTPAPSYAIVHPAQISPSYNQDFIGFGTYKGQQPGGSAGCPTYTGSGWNIYVDGAYGGVYFCSVLGNIAGNAQSQSFIVQRASPSCPGQYVPGWNVLWQRVVVGCVSATYTSADFVTAGAENFRAKSGQAIAVTYVQLQYRPVGFSYRDWPSHTDSKDSGYTIKPYGGLVNSYSITP